jgi:hypothetical protein
MTDNRQDMTDPGQPGESPAREDQGTTDHQPSLAIDPNRAGPSDWREPAWIPPRDRGRDARPSLMAIIVGVGFIAVGLYYFLDRTLGITMPVIRWNSLWPILLILLGGLVIIRSIERRR